MQVQYEVVVSLVRFYILLLDPEYQVREMLDPLTNTISEFVVLPKAILTGTIASWDRNSEYTFQLVPVQARYQDPDCQVCAILVVLLF